jgi:hypothetical protein
VLRTLVSPIRAEKTTANEEKDGEREREKRNCWRLLLLVLPSR